MLKTQALLANAGGHESEIPLLLEFASWNAVTRKGVANDDSGLDVVVESVLTSATTAYIQKRFQPFILLRAQFG